VKGNGKTTLNGLPLSLFPEASTSGDELLETTVEDFCKRIGSVVSCVGSDALVSNTELKNILWNGDFVATDTTRMAISRGEKIGHNLVIPFSTAMLLLDVSREISKSPLKIFKIEDRVIIFKMNGCIITSALGAGKFPEYEKIVEISKNSKYSIEFDKSEMTEILKRCSIFEDRNMAIQFRMSDGRLLVKVGADEGHSEYVKSAILGKDMDNTMYLKSEAFSDCISGAPEKKIKLQFDSMERSVFVNQEKWFYFMMPLLKGA
jgi:DNA polymerase III sliding clamp (beta) subunit (PCNA family)